MKNLKLMAFAALLAGLAISSCKKQKTVFDDPYANAKPALGISTNPQQIPVPASGGAGTTVTITATGLSDYYKAGKLTFLFNGQVADIKEVTDTYIKVVVPSKASSGVTAFVVGGQLVFGPIFTVTGKVNLDPTYVNTVGTNGPVYKAFPIPLSTQVMIIGNFDNYQNQGVIRKTRRVVRTFADGSWDRSFQSGEGANATVYDMAQVGPWFYLVGDLTGYAQQGGLVARIAKIATNGQIDTMKVITYLKKEKFVPTFNGGVTGGSIYNIYPVGTNKMVVTGGFTFYTSHRYDQNTYDFKDSVVTDSVDVRQICRLNDDGSIDQSWRYLPNDPGYRPGKIGRSLPGANGPFRTVVSGDLANGGKILCYGLFSTFDGVTHKNICRLNADGSLDPSFTADGSDGAINWVSYNATLNKYLAVGIFNNFNGKPSQYMVQLNYDGTIDNSFVPKVFDGGTPYFVKLLSDGLAVVNGSFKSYDGVIRNSFAIINQTGSLADGYNTIGNLSGSLLDVFETKSADNKRALLLMGSFYSFDSQPKQNIVRVTIE